MDPSIRGAERDAYFQQAQFLNVARTESTNTHRVTVGSDAVAHFEAVDPRS